jgi:lysophospholipase L1-like esterase
VSPLRRLLVLVTTTTTLTIITLIGCFFLSEKFFFDKLYYQKSFFHGYITPYNYHFPRVFGKRGSDIPLVEDDNFQLAESDKNKFIIVLLGDSFTWGVGIRNNQRYASLLEKKLNKIRPTKVISLAKPGWNIIEYDSAYQKIVKKVKPSLVIFALVHNDVFINSTSLDDPIFKHCQQQYPDIKATMAYRYDDVINSSSALADKVSSFSQISHEGWQNQVNLCNLDSHLLNLPTDKTIYFLTDNYNPQDSLYNIYHERLQMYQKNILSSSIGQYVPQYTPIWDHDPHSSLTVSKSEGHPNALANQMYADILYQEITTNQKYLFSSK